MTENSWPEYRSHKVVSAIEILMVRPHEKGGAVITATDLNIMPIAVDQDFVEKHNPRIGGYIVQYEDGYMSWSPTMTHACIVSKAFEKGYTLTPSSRPARGSNAVSDDWTTISTAELKALREEVAEREASFNLRWKADMRAIKRWQAATGEELTWPDHADLVVWLLQQNAALQERINEIAAGGFMIDATGEFIELSEAGLRDRAQQMADLPKEITDAAPEE